jgi:CRP/FNR family transcriptional regulator, cyclic AMP receptor protein
VSVRADAQSLAHIPLFRDCDPVPLQILAFSADRVSFNEDDTIIREGDIPHGAYFIMSGTVSLVRGNTVQDVIGEGALVGETSMIGEVPYSLTIRAREPVSAARIDKGLFLRVAGEYPEFGHAVLRALSEKLSGTMRDFDRIRVQLSGGRSFSDL